MDGSLFHAAGTVTELPPLPGPTPHPDPVPSPQPGEPAPGPDPQPPTPRPDPTPGPGPVPPTPSPAPPPVPPTPMPRPDVPQPDTPQADAQPPLYAYAALATTFAGAYGALLLAARERLPERFAPYDLVLVSLATHKVSRLVARDRVTRPLRAPFTDVEHDDPPRELREHARGRGLRRALGELLSCPYCLDQWVGGAFIGGLALAPRPTRATAALFSVVTASDYLQHIHRWARSAG